MGRKRHSECLPLSVWCFWLWCNASQLPISWVTMLQRKILCRSPTRPLPAIASSRTERPCISSNVLAKVADRQLPGDRDRALVGSFLADHHPEQRCFARPIGTDQSDFFAGIQLKRSIHEEQLLAILLIDVGERDHSERSNSRHAASSSVARPENRQPTESNKDTRRKHR